MPEWSSIIVGLMGWMLLIVILFLVYIWLIDPARRERHYWRYLERALWTGQTIPMWDSEFHETPTYNPVRVRQITYARTDEALHMEALFVGVLPPNTQHLYVRCLRRSAND